MGVDLPDDEVQKRRIDHRGRRQVDAAESNPRAQAGIGGQRFHDAGDDPAIDFRGKLVSRRHRQELLG